MIRTLYIRNYALIEEIEVEFSDGLNVLTGETGAGKSIVIGALGLLVGERASADMVRSGADRGIVEGTFTIGDNEPARQLLRAHDYDAGNDHLLVRREIASRGTSRAFINDSPAPLALLKDLGDLLVDLHGQHDHQLLLRPSTHLTLLDDAGGLSKIAADFAVAYKRILDLEQGIDQLRRRESELRERHDYYQFQLREFDAVSPQPNEEAHLERELRLLENGERLLELTSDLHSLLYADEQSVRDQLVRARNLLHQLSRIEPAFGDHHNELSNVILTIEEVARSVQSYAARFDVSFERLEELRERLQALRGLRKKFGGSLDAVIEYIRSIRDQVALARNFDQEIASRDEDLRSARQAGGELAARLSRKRHEVGRRIARSVERVLKSLGIAHGHFLVDLQFRTVAAGTPGSVTYHGDHYAANESGFDIGEFYISTNIGEEPKPLARVASGGEISRVMLALKTILAKNDRLPLLVFDEIDVGVSGRIASKVGATMRDLAHFHQIIAITHLPQIAAMSQDHYIVEKREESGRAMTVVRRLAPDEHVVEIARLVSGEEVTESSLRMARELIAS